MPNRRGSILVLVLWTLSMLTVFSVTLGMAARQRAMLLDRLVSLDGLSAAAWSGVERARTLVIEDLEDDNDSFGDRWASNPRAFSKVKMADGQFDVKYRLQDPLTSQWLDQYGIMDENRKLSLNKADAASLARLIEHAQVPRDVAQEIAFCILDWRDGDAAYGHPNYGAEDTDYDDLPAAYACKDAPFESIDELLLVKGMTRDIFNKIKADVTVFGGVVNVNTASRSVLKALGMDSGLAEKVILFRAGKDGKSATDDDVIFLNSQTIISVLNRGTPPLSSFEQTTMTNLILAEKLGTASTHFWVSSYGTARSGATLEVGVVLDRTGKTLFSKSSGVQWPSKASNSN